MEYRIIQDNVFNYKRYNMREALLKLAKDSPKTLKEKCYAIYNL